MLENPVFPVSDLNLVFVDESVANYQDLVSGIVPSSPHTQIDVVTLDSLSDGIQQIEDALQQYGENQVSAIHIVSHGSAGSVQLGNTTLDNSSLNAYQDELLGWGHVLADEGDLLFYGCNVGQGVVGQNFVDQLSGLTGADIAASDDLTGAAELGGDWEFEVAEGNIEAGLIFDDLTTAAYNATLATALDISDDSDAWGQDFSNQQIATVDLSKITKSNLTIKVNEASNRVVISRSSLLGSSSRNTITLKLDSLLSSGTRAAISGTTREDTLLDLSQISSDSTIKLVSRGDVTVNFGNGSRFLRFDKIEDITGPSGSNNAYEVESDGSISGTLTARGENNTLEYLGSQSSTVDLSESEASGFNRISGIDEVIGSAGTDVLTASEVESSQLTGNAGKDVITGGSQGDTLIGSAGDDLLLGEAGADSLEGGANDDTLVGGAGSDTISGGTGSDTYRFANTFGSDMIKDTSGSSILDFEPVTQDLVVTVGPSMGQGIVVTAGSNKVGGENNNGVQNVTEFINGSGRTTFRFDNGFTQNTDALKIDSLNNLTQPVELDFSAIESDLDFEIVSDLVTPAGSNPAAPTNEIIWQIKVRLDANSATGRKLLATIQVKDFVNNVLLTGGKGNNDYGLRNSEAVIRNLGGDFQKPFPGAIIGGPTDQDLSQKINTLDLSKFALDNSISEEFIVNLDDNTVPSFQSNLANGKPISHFNAVIAGNQYSRVVGSNRNFPEFLTGSEATAEFNLRGGDNHASLIKGGDEDGDLVGGNLADTILGGSGNEFLRGNKGNDSLVGEDGKDVIQGNEGDDTLLGGLKDDTLTGGTGEDTIKGGSGDDKITGGADDDSLIGGTGNDTYFYNNDSANWGQDTIVEKKFDGKKDTLDFSGLNDAPLTFIVDGDSENQIIKAGRTSGFRQDAPINILGAVQFREAGGTFSGDSIEAPNVEVILPSVNKENTFIFGEQWKKLTIDNIEPNRPDTALASSLILDFRGVSQPLTFKFFPDGSLTVTAESAAGLLSGKSVTVTKVDENTVIYGGRFENNFLSLRSDSLNPLLNAPAEFKGTIIGGGGAFNTNDPSYSATERAKVINLGSGVVSSLGRILSAFKVPVSDISGGRIAIPGAFVQNTVSFDAGAAGNRSTGNTGSQSWTDYFKGLAGGIVSSNLFNALGVYSYDLGNINGSGQTARSLSTGGFSGFTGTLRFIDNVDYGAGITVADGTRPRTSNGLNPFGSNTFAPGTTTVPRTGASLFYGGLGGDTYAYTNLWGLSAILEVPDVNIQNQAGTSTTSLETFYDTLDLSAVSDSLIDVREYTSTDLLEAIAGNNTDLSDFPANVGSNLLIVQGQDPFPNSLRYIIEEGITTFGATWFDGAGDITEASSILAALDIENIDVGKNTTLRFYDDAKLQGALSSLPFDLTSISNLLGRSPFTELLGLLFNEPNVNLDYSNYASGVEVEGDAGIEVQFQEIFGLDNQPIGEDT